MTTAGKALAFPLYAIVDAERPLPNFMLDRSNPAGNSLLVFSSSHKAVAFADRMMVSCSEMRLTFCIIQTEKGLRGILIALSELLPQLRWVLLDPAGSPRRSPRRWAVKDLIDLEAKKG